MKESNTNQGIPRGRIAFNVALQTLAAAIILVLVNYLGFQHYRRWDFSRSEKFALSSQTRQLLKHLKKELRVIVFFSPEVTIYGEVSSLLKEYQYAADGKIHLETVDQYRDLSRARELQTKYKFGASENVLILDYNGRVKFVNAADMAEFEQSDMLTGEPPRLRVFKGEQALTSALIELIEERQSRLYVLQGHGEPGVHEDEFKLLRTYLERQNLKIEPLTLGGTSAVPGDAAALLLAGPRYDLSDMELLRLRTYWHNKGRLFVALEPSATTPRLREFLVENGVIPQDDRLVATIPLGPVTGVVRTAQGRIVEGSKAVKRLKDINTLFPGNTQSLKLGKANGIRVQSLVEAADGFWGETAYDVDINRGGRFVFEPTTDHAPPLVLAAAVERGEVDDPRVNVGGGRMVVFGNADFLHADALAQVQPNVDLILNCVNWLLDRGELAGVAPKVAQYFTLNLTESQVLKIAVLTMLAIPGSAALVGLLVWLRRRR